MHKSYSETDYGDDPIRDAAEDYRRGQAAETTPKPPSFPTLDPAALHGPLGEAAAGVCEHSEAGVAAVLARLVTIAGSMSGRGPHFAVGGAEHNPRVFTLVCGATSSGRKGQSWADACRIMKAVDADFMSGRVAGGLSSGQGLIHAIRDSAGDDDGEPDKRLVVYESEFAAVLQNAGREANTLSSIIRQAWDGGTLRQLTRNPYVATDPHVCVTGDITPRELRELLNRRDRANGFANRFAFIASRRDRVLPFGGSLKQADVERLAAPIRRGLETARTIGRMSFDRDAATTWQRAYLKLTDDEADDVAGLTSRAAPNVLRLSMIYALAEGSDRIRRPHVDAGLALWAYAEASCRWAFHGTTDPGPAALRAWIEGRGGAATAAELARSGPRRYRGKPDDAEAALRELAEAGAGTLGYATQARGGRPALRFALPGYGDKTPRGDAVTGGFISTGAADAPAQPGDTTRPGRGEL
ncbi:MAG: hypothetical protein ACFCVE_06590 [Phycisphaerae bacterium]